MRKRSRELHNKLSQKEAVIREGRSKLESLTRRGIKISEQIHQDELSEQDASARLSDGQARLTEINLQLNAALLQLDAAKKRLSRDRVTLKARLRDVYEDGNVGILQVLLDSRNIMDFMNRREYARRVVGRDLSIVRQVDMDEQEISQESLFLKRMQVRRAAEVQEIQAETDRLNAAIQDRVSVLQATEQQISIAEESLAETESESAKITGMLRRLQSMPILTLYGPHGRAIHYHLHWMGRFITPAEGPITSPFGYRYHPILHVYKLHTGVDIGAPFGSVVHAAAAGVVIHASWLGAYGNGVIIDHGNGLATLYGHLSRIEVVVGQEINQGQPIGLVGSTGLSTGPHLHFEARKYGTPIPPF